MTGREPELLIIDTDGGGDDAVAILLALSDKSVAKTLAITCCFGNTSLDNVCSNILKLLHLCNEKQIPVHRGSKGPLLKSQVELNVFGTDGFGNVAHEFSTGSLEESDLPASSALITLARKYPGRIHLIAIGPLTNISIAHRIDPDFTKNLKSIFCMGGNYKCVGNISEVAEFNFYCDPESAHIVLTEAQCPVTLIPWETVPEFGITWDIYEELMAIQTTKAQFVKRINEFYVVRSKKKGNKRYCDCDFLAVASLLYPECISNSLDSAVAVECNGFYTRGMTILIRENHHSDKCGVSLRQRKIRIITGFNEEVLNKLRFQLLR
ncbi:nucleoside hydrolase isoform X2 [Parasteatoda tepidariorum]|nr:inosine-uridine preferring nucleoside hydrolase [Parasteatoda tepidariorum]XP_042906814.1 inosine-uridine preferring nucleoside hydrolase [Parasteatoda tepidariorum]XP_042906815.1 inosine-uridine preferring nucleoside hydrolase [Parasteatoda tepidariorum]XP_042906816.1 inosine-uridine preferring nucleoside hydrolase [Parasteatoda tepidariorum]